MEKVQNVGTKSAFTPIFNFKIIHIFNDTFKNKYLIF